jgi:hypothetical protein
MERVLLIQSLSGERVAEVRQTAKGHFSIDTDEPSVRAAVDELLERGRRVGLLHNHDHRQRTDKGQIFRMYGRWSRPGDPDFLDALADALLEFNLLAYTVELVNSD